MLCFRGACYSQIVKIGVLAYDFYEVVHDSLERGYSISSSKR